MRNTKLFKKALSVVVAAAMTVTVGQTATFAGIDTNSKGVSTYAAENNETYKYVYAGLTWQEYWASEGVYEAGNIQSSDVQDSRGESDKGAFDAVTRATTNHGIHRGSFQCNTTIYDEDENTYNVLYWKSDENGKGTSQCVLTDGRTIDFSKGTITYTDAEGAQKTAKMKDYVVTGIKYVPIAVKEADYEAFKAKYITVENGGKLAGGYSENNLKSYTEVANVTKDTNGLKTVTKNEDGSFTFGKRQTGTESGIQDKALVKDEGVTVEALENDDIGAYGEFMRVDLKGNYGDLGSRMQAVRWTYYGNDDKYETPVISYGTKFAADNWMHKANGIQLGLTDSIRCQLPKDSDGTGYWKITVYALGHEDYEVKLNLTKANVKIGDDSTTIDTTELAKVVADAEKLNEADYTADSWKVFKEEFDEAKAELANPQSQATVNEAIQHLNAAITSLVKASGTDTTKPETTTPVATTPKATTAAKKALKSTKITGKVTKKLKATKIKLTFKKVSGAKKYTVQVATTNKFKKVLYKKTVKSTKVTLTSKKLKNKKKLYVRVKAVGANKWSKPVAVKIKK
ncbi:MAG: penicillin-binding Tp47 domain C-containing protein [Eubacterium sp.]|nr:penicillin-binding Tp47 domain C-containing protein [Eubacterium sp.]